MAILRCKVCGAPLNIDGKERVVVCKYCGTKTILPGAEDEQAGKPASSEAGSPSQKQKRKRLVILLLLLLLLIAGTVAGLKYLQPVIRQNSAYRSAAALRDEGKIKEAIEAFASLRGYKDSASQILLLETELLQQAAVGDTVLFGTYEQDNNTGNGKEEIEWLVLDKDGSKLLLISKYALDCRKYNDSETAVTWETCSLRTWLNGTFLKTAFGTEEQERILTTTVTADKNPKYDTDPGKDTQDRVFLLSLAEADRYCASNDGRLGYATAYIRAKGAYVGNNQACWWWLRSPGYDSDRAAYVDFDGTILDLGYSVNYDRGAVRPALWVDSAP